MLAGFWVIVAFFMGLLVGFGLSEGALKMANKLMVNAQNMLSLAKFNFEQAQKLQEEMKQNMEAQAKKAVKAEYNKLLKQLEVING